MAKNDVSYYLKLGQDYRLGKDFDSALSQLNQALSFAPDDAEVYLELGRVYREKEDFDIAINNLKKAMAFSPENSEIYLELGRTYREKGDYAEAIQELNVALRRNPADGRVCLELGRVHQKQNNVKLTMRALKAAVAYGLDNDEVHLELGRAYRVKGDYLNAIEAFKRAIEHNPNAARMHLELGWVYYDNEDYSLAVKELEQALFYGIDSEELHISLGRMYRKAGECELSVKEFRKVIEGSPKKEDIFFYNKMLNEVEISQKKIVLESKPIGLGVTLTNKCNLQCRICGVWKEKWELPEKVIREVVGLFPYLERIVWQGGEVFLLDYFNDLFLKASTYPNLKQSIVTNGTLINEKWAEKLARENVALIFSIDGITKETYEYVVNGGARFEDLIKNISFINAFRKRHNCHKDPFNKMTTILNMVVMESNYRQLNEIVSFAKEYEFDEIQLVPLLGIKGPENIFSNQDPRAGAYLAENMPGIIKDAGDCGIILHNWLPPIAVIKPDAVSEREDGRDDSRVRSREKKNSDIPCYLPWQQMFMTPDHKLKPGCYCGQDIGDINTNSLEEIWNGEVMQLYRRKILAGDYHDICDQACVTGVIPQKELKVSRYG